MCTKIEVVLFEFHFLVELVFFVIRLVLVFCLYLYLLLPLDTNDDSVTKSQCWVHGGYPGHFPDSEGGESKGPVQGNRHRGSR